MSLPSIQMKGDPQTLTVLAGGNITRGRFVDANEANTVQITTAGAMAGGVALATASAGKVLRIAISGVVSVEAGAAIAVGAFVATDNAGRAVTATTGNYILGQAITAAGAAGSEVLVRINLSGAKV